MRLSHVISTPREPAQIVRLERIISCRTMSRMTSIALRMRGLRGRWADVAMDRDVVSGGFRWTRPHFIRPLTGFHRIHRQNAESMTLAREIDDRGNALDFHGATRIFRSTLAKAFSTDMRRA